ncbi:MAG: DEAD/DEAH box helicase, partial [Syntrophales bacterium]|nr:DEAD/DEAH box helicase [Syntrophales bacterium]
MFVKVALNIPTPETFNYAVPAELRGRVTIGSLVAVPFGKRQLDGFVVAVDDDGPFSEVREITAVLPGSPFFHAADLPFYLWMADYYLYPLGKLLAEVIPAYVREGKGKRRSHVEAGEAEGVPMGGQEVVLLNAHQRAALETILEGIRTHRFCSFLLHGVTGSGKTEVYLRAVAEVIKGEGGVIFLVPEIGLTPQLIRRLRDRFPREPLAILHSGETPARRREAWRLLREGKMRIAVGARSALFAPVAPLRLIIVDEEHDESYKQDERMRYNARDLALVRGRMAEGTVILGSATPSVQTYYHALAGRHRLVVLSLIHIS